MKKIVLGMLLAPLMLGAAGKSKVVKPKMITPPPIHNPYGSVVATDLEGPDGFTVERIALAVPEYKDSNKKIIRQGMLYRQPGAIATIVICHGFMTCKEDVQFLRQIFTPGKYNYMSFDFRAHGEHAAGQRCTFGRDECNEVMTAVRFLKSYEPTSNKPVILYAFSMGAVASLEAQAQDPSLFAAMVCDCPFDSSETIIKRGLDNLKFQFFGCRFNVPARDVLQKYAFHPYVQAMMKAFLKSLSYVDIRNIDIRLYPVNTAEAVHSIKVPCFFIHCRNDEKVSVDSVKLLYGRVGSPYKKLWITNGRCHYDSFSYNPEKYIKEVRSFVDAAATGRLNGVNKQEVVEDKPDVRQTRGYVWGIGTSQVEK